MAIYHPIRRYNFPPKRGAKGVLKFPTPLLRKDTAPSIPTGMSRNATCPHGTNHSSPITVPNKGMPRNRASPLHIILNSTSLLTFARKFLFPLCQFFLPLLTRIEFLDFRYKESGEGINDGLRQFDFVWILVFFRGGHGLLPQQRTFLAQLSPSHAPSRPYKANKLWHRVR